MASSLSTAHPTAPSSPANTRIFVAGHRGLVGGAIYRSLLSAGYQDLRVRTHAELDLTDQAATRGFLQAERPQVVILAAARVGGILANWRRPYEFITDNLAIELNVIDAAFRAGVRRLLFLGSSCIYPREAPQPLKEEYLLTGPLEETNRPYALAKIAGIELCRSLNREHGTDYLSLMPTNLYGPGDNFDLESSHVLPAMIRKFHEATTGGAATASTGTGSGARVGAAKHEPVTLWGTGSPRREFLHVDDLAAAVRFVLENGVKAADVPDGLLNVGTGEDLTIRELAGIVQRVVGHQGPVRWDESKPDGTPRKLLDVTRLKSLGWRPQLELEPGIRQTYEWYLEQETKMGSAQEQEASGAGSR
jgi:GDP-L-fucose synthase